MTDIQLLKSQPLTMTSREIAELTGKRHNNVKTDISKMLSELQEDVLKFQHIYFDSINREQIEYKLDRELTETLLTGYSATLRRKVVRRLRELEEQAASATQQAALTSDAIKQIEEDYKENLKHHKNYELGESLLKAVRAQDYDSVRAIDKVLDSMDLNAASRAQGIPVESVRNHMASHLEASAILRRMTQGEHAHDDPVKDVVQWARAIVKLEDAKKEEARMLEIARRPKYLEGTYAYDMAHKYDNGFVPPKEPAKPKRRRKSA